MQINHMPKGKRVAVRRPRRVGLLEFLRGHWLRIPPMFPDHKYLPGLARQCPRERDLPSVRRPMSKPCLHRRVSELQPLASIRLASPQRALGITDVSHPLPVACEFHIPGRYSSQVGNEISGLGLIAQQFSPRLRTHYKQFFPISAQGWKIELQRPGRELHRLTHRFSPPIRSRAHHPDIARAVPRVLKEVIPAIRRPYSATLGRSSTPTWKQLMHFTTIRPRFPQGGVVVQHIDQGEAEPLFIR